MITGLDHIVLTVRDIDRAAKFNFPFPLTGRSPATQIARRDTSAAIGNGSDHLEKALRRTRCKKTGRGGGLSVIGYHDPTRPKSLQPRILP